MNENNKCCHASRSILLEQTLFSFAGRIIVTRINDFLSKSTKKIWIELVLFAIEKKNICS